MLHVGTDHRFAKRRTAPESVLSLAEFVAAWHAFARRQKRTLLVFPLLTIAVALLYLATATPKFTAEAVLLVEPKRNDGSTQSIAGDFGSTASIMDSQVEILKSEKIALSVIRTLQLTKDPEFVGPIGGPIGVALRLTSLSTSQPDTELSLTRRALERFYRRLTVKRVGLTQTIGIQFEALSAERAAQIANAIAQGYTTDQLEANYESAHVATDWLQGRVDELHGKASAAQKALEDHKAAHLTTSQAQLELRELEISAQVYRRLYDSFLQRYLESVEQQSFPISQTRLVTVASPPLRPSSPKTLLVLAVSLVGGVVVGFGVGLLRDAADLTFRTRERVLAELHTECIGIVPATVAGGTEIVSLSPKPLQARTSARTIVCADALFRNISDTPSSHFSESIRSVKLAVDAVNRGGRRTQVIGITSALPNEGKTTVATALAQLLAQNRGRAILLDCDLRNPSLSATLVPDATLSILDVASGRVQLDDAKWIDPATGLHFLPTPSSSRPASPSEALASQRMARLFKTLREAYDYVVVDLSPIAPFVDVRAAVPLMDSFILVVEWGHTNIDVVKRSLDVASEVYGSLAGVVLNKANVTELKRYGDAFDSYPEQHPKRSDPRK